MQCIVAVQILLFKLNKMGSLLFTVLKNNLLELKFSNEALNYKPYKNISRYHRVAVQVCIHEL